MRRDEASFCQNHPHEPAEYFCETCKQLLCTLCRIDHKKHQPSHETFNCKESGLEMMLELSETGHIFLGPELSDHVCKLLALADSFRKWLVDDINSLEEKYGAGKERGDVERRMRDLDMRQQYVELYQYCRELKRGRNVFRLPTGSAEGFRQELHDSLDGLLDRLVDSYSDLADDTNFRSAAARGDQQASRGQPEVTRLGGVEKTGEVVPRFRKAEVLKIEDANEDDILRQLKAADMSRYKMISVDDYRCGDHTAALVANIAERNPQISGLYLCSFSLYHITCYISGRIDHRSGG